MYRAVTSAVLLLAACGEADAPGGGQAAGTFTKHGYEGPDGPPRDYWLYVPAQLPSRPPLVIYLHGCNQSPEEAAAGVGWNELADQRGFLLVYPEQATASVGTEDVDGNDARCWNWYLPQNQARGAGEPASIAGITRQVASAFAADPQRTYLMGISAGGAMATVMGATYPDLYGAVAIFAGCPFACSDPGGTRAYEAMGEFARPLPLIVIQGTADEVVLFPLGVATVNSWLRTNDLADDGLPNASVPPQPASTEHHGLDASLVAGLGSPGDLCLTPPLALPCLAGALGWESYPHSIEHYVDAQGAPLLDFWIVHGLGHNYVGGSRAGTFSDPHGPDVTAAAYRFFLDHPLPESPP